MVKRYLEETGIPKVTGRDDRLSETSASGMFVLRLGPFPILAGIAA